MGWFVVLLVLVIGVAAFMWLYRRRLAARTGPWIASELAPDD